MQGVTAAMHLLLLVAVSWMLVEGLLIWRKVAALSMSSGPRMTLYYATGWGEARCPTLALFSALPCMAPPPHTQHHHETPISTPNPPPISDTSSIFSALSTSNSTQVQFFSILLHFTCFSPHLQHRLPDPGPANPMPIAHPLSLWIPSPMPSTQSQLPHFPATQGSSVTPKHQAHPPFPSARQYACSYGTAVG